jgi:predicted transcriptional regulator
MKRINLELNEEFYTKVKKIALYENKSVSFVIREAISSYQKDKTEIESENDPFFELANKIKLKGPKDLSEKHDKYLYDLGRANNNKKGIKNTELKE